MGDAYPDAVATYVADRGWEAATSRVREDTVVVTGRRETADGTDTLLGVVVTGDGARVAEPHVKYLLSTASDRRPDEVFVTAPAGLTDAASALADEYGVPVVDRDDVPFEPVEASAADSSDDAAGDDATAGAGGTADDSSDEAGFQWTDESDGEADAGRERAQRAAGAATDVTDRDAEWGRRDALKLGGVAALAAGGWFVYDRVFDSGIDGPADVVRAFYGAVDAGNVARARELIHEDGESIDAANIRETSVEIVSLERVETDRADTAKFRITIRVNGRYTEEAVVDLQKNENGEWRMLAV
ncbi:nuclear transport factor 2 family protein [Halobacterium litoreum]|uniref:DUF4878 domain-containing protein n=1 Tax=Halobacterium litoreum TaxID=2039234 RepID=A0ABD5NEI3_9EURY|nr:hypothetical protein [Halobacterium litoreum]UHH13557.1 hypothetical protein LT972_00840 [Halobacterium litoreum]